MKKTTAPIALFVYNRLSDIEQTVKSLQKNKLTSESDLFIFSDGQKDGDVSDKIPCVRNYLKTIDGFKSVTIIEREKNMGLANSIISGVTEIINKFGKIIVLEDDLILSPYFLSYMNQGLDMYEDENLVFSIHGHMYPTKMKNLPQTFFLSFIDTWGWATWKRAWDKLNTDPKILLEEIKEKNAEYRFNIDGSHSFIHHIKANIIGRWNTWGIKWYASVFLSDGIGLFPANSLVRHIGFGDDATHAKITDEPTQEISNKPIDITKITIKESVIGRKALRDYYLSLEKNCAKRYFKLFKENLKRIIPIKWAFDFLRSKVYDERNSI
jgi:hypothetical protein